MLFEIGASPEVNIVLIPFSYLIVSLLVLHGMMEREYRSVVLSLILILLFSYVALYTQYKTEIGLKKLSDIGAIKEVRGTRNQLLGYDLIKSEEIKNDNK